MRKKRNVNVKILPIIKEDNVCVPKEIAKYLLDISKLIIGGAVITTALDMVFNKAGLLIIAGVIAIIFALAGFIILIYIKK